MKHIYNFFKFLLFYILILFLSILILMIFSDIESFKEFIYLILNSESCNCC